MKFWGGTKRISIGTLVLVCIYINPLKADEWSWLDQPDKRIWSQIELNGYGWNLSFAIPDKKGFWPEQTIRYPRHKKRREVQIIDIPLEQFYSPGQSAIKFDWERRWGGFGKETWTDFFLDVRVLYKGKEYRLLNQTLEQRMQRVVDYYSSYYSDDSDSIERKTAFFEDFVIQPYESSQSYVWTLENDPDGWKIQETYRLPVSQDHEVSFWFYYRWEMGGGKDDPEWLARRKELSRKILDTVKITPDPYIE